MGDPETKTVVTKVRMAMAESTGRIQKAE